MYLLSFMFYLQRDPRFLMQCLNTKWKRVKRWGDINYFIFISCYFPLELLQFTLTTLHSAEAEFIVLKSYRLVHSQLVPPPPFFNCVSPCGFWVCYGYRPRDRGGRERREPVISAHITLMLTLPWLNTHHGGNRLLLSAVWVHLAEEVREVQMHLVVKKKKRQCICLWM